MASKKMTKSYFDVLGICCTSEVPLIENILKSMDGVKEYSVIVPSRTVIVVHDTLILSQFQIGKSFSVANLIKLFASLLQNANVVFRHLILQFTFTYIYLSLCRYFN